MLAGRSAGAFAASLRVSNVAVFPPAVPTPTPISFTLASGNRIAFESNRDASADGRYSRALSRLKGYPTWTNEERADVEQYCARLRPQDVKALGMGSPLDAALDAPRWAAALSSRLSSNRPCDGGPDSPAQGQPDTL